jgi:hypothetical protein
MKIYSYYFRSASGDSILIISYNLYTSVEEFLAAEFPEELEALDGNIDYAEYLTQEFDL